MEGVDGRASRTATRMMDMQKENRYHSNEEARRRMTSDSFLCCTRPCFSEIQKFVHRYMVTAAQDHSVRVLLTRHSYLFSLRHFPPFSRFPMSSILRGSLCSEFHVRGICLTPAWLAGTAPGARLSSAELSSILGPLEAGAIRGVQLIERRRNLHRCAVNDGKEEGQEQKLVERPREHGNGIRVAWTNLRFKELGNMLSWWWLARGEVRKGERVFQE